ncbi:glutaredoxin domain-containing protein [Mycolicibacter arupensis]|uniref:glutaredoxin domain-containing protein n=1 Tax=Mycolicibacter arupensis TaxID=342002 RepID=UPI0023F425B1|nr:glutaredoxin domain-containing protein [Mycolicibacter arupensis]
MTILAVPKPLDTRTGKPVQVTVFTAARCVQCEYTKRHLHDHGIPARIIDVSQSPDAAEYLRREGFASLPVVFPADPKIAPWTGFRPTLLDELT